MKDFAYITPERHAPKGGGSATGHRLPGLRAHLIGLVLAVLLPALALGGATAWHMAANYRHAFEERLSATARALALALDAELGAHVAALSALAASPDLGPDGDPEAFRSLAAPAMARLGSWVVVMDETGRRQILNTLLPPGAPLPPPQDLPGAPLLERALATGEPVVLNMHRGAASGELLPAVLVPVVRSGQAVRLLGAPVLPGNLSRILSAQIVSEEGFATLLDGHGLIVARSAQHDTYFGRPALSWFAAAMENRDHGITVGPSLSGQDALIAFHRLASAPSWVITVGEPRQAYQASWLIPLLGLGAGGTAAFALALGLAVWLSRRMLRPVRDLVRRADVLAASGDTLTPPAPVAPIPVAEFETLRLAGERAHAALRRGDEDLRESEAQFRAAFEQSTAAMSQVDCATGRLLRVNAAYCALLGRTEAELVGQPFSDFVHPEDREADLEGFRRMCRGEAPSHHASKRYVRPDGSIRWAELSSSPVRDTSGRLVRTVAVASDVTERKAAEEALRQGEARLRLAQEAAGIGAWEWDPATGEMVWTAEIFALLGLDPAQDARPSFDRFMAVVHPDDRARLLTLTEAAIVTGELEGEFRVLRRQGEETATRWLLSRARRIRGPGGEPDRFLGVNIDITERKEAEDRQALLMREVDHRAKNALAVVQAALRLTPADDPKAYAAAVTGRVDALARAHTLLAEGRWAGTDLRNLVTGELAAFLPAGPDANGGARVVVEGPRAMLTPAASQAVSMALHELATNATKYGALSVPGGWISVTWMLDSAADVLRLRWAETGGPPLDTPPSRRGLGSRVIEATLRDQLGGRVERSWERSGLVCMAELPLARVLTERAGLAAG